MKDDSLNIKTASKRKSDHLELAQKSRVNPDSRDGRFLYEPMLGTVGDVDLSTTFLDTVFDAPIWVSSMTGGTKYASKINKNLARLCRDLQEEQNTPQKSIKTWRDFAVISILAWDLGLVVSCWIVESTSKTFR